MGVLAFAELEAEGLVGRAPDPSDRRQAVLSPTGAGRRAREADMAQRDTWLAGAFGALSETERGVLSLAASVLERLGSTP
ncbi:hypothetical protein ABZX77_19640 [Streptomyces sp. NPDC004237]|uniref:MarR family winged helix-turn-helix transcriptional regulator n=1 Tax=Streptomyces sp. NPDC004237 TaxID=3154455 RepID=UPI0033BAD308